MDMVPTAALTAFAEALVEADDRVRLAHVLAVHSRQLLDVAAVSVLLAGSDGVLMTDGAPDQPDFTALFDLQRRRGPTSDCYHYGRSVAITVSGAWYLGWPTLAEAMNDVGVVVADAVPLGVRGRTVGVLTAYRDEINPGLAERRLGGLVRGLANLSVGKLPTAQGPAC